MLYIGQGLPSLETFCSLMCLPNPVCQKAYDKINAKIADLAVMGPGKTCDTSLLEYVDWGKTRKFLTWKSCPLIAKDVTLIKGQNLTKI
ncbi:hypothetical protein TNIN_5551 [Trichonephila inaurata madagascariensis]|uniref:Uncharacterized protein n=1 Tax=Trichonephila inaurata madagascariensis TaxID=2747483 RepID=A0A8X7C2T9_9ARAC|nr:hypothetical protein TNIN_5551 [Trichonephila inaurata madagascariensis]